MISITPLTPRDVSRSGNFCGSTQLDAQQLSQKVHNGQCCVQICGTAPRRDLSSRSGGSNGREARRLPSPTHRCAMRSRRMSIRQASCSAFGGARWCPLGGRVSVAQSRLPSSWARAVLGRSVVRAGSSTAHFRHQSAHPLTALPFLSACGDPYSCVRPFAVPGPRQWLRLCLRLSAPPHRSVARHWWQASTPPVM